MAQASELAGGTGFTFEDLVAASYVTALLQEGFAPGVENRIVSRVALQQRDFGATLGEHCRRGDSGEAAADDDHTPIGFQPCCTAGQRRQQDRLCVSGR